MKQSARDMINTQSQESGLMDADARTTWGHNHCTDPHVQ